MEKNENRAYSLDEAIRKLENKEFNIWCHQGDLSALCTTKEEMEEFYAEFQQLNS